MKAFIVSLNVKPEYVDAFIAVTERNARGSVKEPGNVRFDVLRDSDDPSSFKLYEVWRDDDAIAAHRDAPHYKEWSAAMPGMLASPRSKTVNGFVYFTEK